MTLKQYYKRVEQLETPANLKSLAEIQKWWLDQFAELQKELSAEDLAELKKNNAHWQDKVNSSILVLLPLILFFSLLL